MKNSFDGRTEKMSYDPNWFKRLVATVFLNRKKASEDDVEEMVNRLLDMPRFRNISDSDVEALEGNPRMLAQKLLQYLLLPNLETADLLVIQNEARRLLGELELLKPKKSEAPLPVAAAPRNVYVMPGIAPIITLQIDDSLGFGNILLPREMFALVTETMLKENLPYVLAELRSTRTDLRFFAKIGESTSSDEVVVSAKLADVLGPSTIVFRIVSRLPVVEHITFRNLDPEVPLSPEAHDTLQMQFESLPGISVGQRFGPLVVARLRSGDENIAYGKLPIFEAHVPYEIEGLKRQRSVMSRCAGCYTNGRHVKYAEVSEQGRVRRFCNAQCQRMAYL